MQILLQIELWSHMPILMNLSQQEGDDRENAHDFDERETFLMYLRRGSWEATKHAWFVCEIFTPGVPFDYWT